MIEIQVIEVNWAEQERAISAIRRAVFVEEQGVPEALEWDGCDAEARHVLASIGSQAVATGRLLPSGHIGRMAVLRPFRRQGIASAVLRQLLVIARANGMQEVFLNAQLQAQSFYTGHGFTADGETFLDAGIPHIHMRLKLR